MSNQELLTYLFNAVALGFLLIALMDVGTRILALYREVFVSSNHEQQVTDLIATHPQQELTQLQVLPNPRKELPPLPDPWLLPSLPLKAVVSMKLEHKEQIFLCLLPPAKESFVESSKPVSEEMFAAIDLNKLKLRQARKIAKVLGIAQKVNGRDQKLAFLVGQIKLKLQQAKAEIIEVVKQELLVC